MNLFTMTNTSQNQLQKDLAHKNINAQTSFYVDSPGHKIFNDFFVESDKTKSGPV